MTLSVTRLLASRVLARKVQVAEMKTQMKHAGEVREKEKKEFWMS